MEILNPAELGRPSGWNNVIKTDNGMVFIAGQVAWDAEHNLIGGDDFVVQFDRALANFVIALAAADCKPADTVQMTAFITDRKKWLAAGKALRDVWKRHFGDHYPTMAMVQVADLMPDGAMIEIQGMAVSREVAK